MISDVVNFVVVQVQEGTLYNLVSTIIVPSMVYWKQVGDFNMATHSLVDVHHVYGMYMYINWYISRGGGYCLLLNN